MNKKHGFEKSSPEAKAEQYEEQREKSTVEKLFERFIKDKRYLANLSERTLDSYYDVFERWIRIVGHEVPTQENLTDFVMGMREVGLSVTTCNISIRSWNSFLTWLYENRHLEHHLRLKQLKEQSHTMKTFTDGQLSVLLAWRPDIKSRNEVRLHVLIFFLVDTGVRISEALTLKVDNVDLENLLVTVMGKGRKERTIPISLEMRKVFHKYLEKYRQSIFPSPYVFCTASGTHWSYHNACREMMKLCRRLDVGIDEIDGVFHAFRRKFARNYVKQGGNLFYLQQTMGHTSLQVTKGYVAADDEDLQNTHKKTSLLSRLFDRKK